MRLKISTLLMIVFHTWLSITTIEAKPYNHAGHNLLKKTAPALEAANSASKEERLQVPEDPLPLAKVAHSDVMDLLHLFLVATPMHLPIYSPFVQQVGLRLNWFEALRNLLPNGQKRCGGGVDLHFRGPIQLSIDFGYLSDKPKEIVYGNRLHYRAKGIYGLGTLLYVMHPNRLTNAYLGIAYGQSHFDLIINDHIPSKSFVAGWIKCVASSELRLVAQLYGGIQFGIGHLLDCTKNDDPRVLNYPIPGYGKIVNKIMPDMTLYLKWTISFLEKQIVI